MEPMADASTVERMLLNQARMKHIPMNGSIELLPLCNLNCKMCYVRLSREEMEAQGRIRSVEEWMTVAREMKKAGVLFLLLTGGEPLLYPGFKELFVELKKTGNNCRLRGVQPRVEVIFLAFGTVFLYDKQKRQGYFGISSR